MAMCPGSDLGEDLSARCLEEWAKTAEGDLLLVEALRGEALGLLEPVSQALSETVMRSPEGVLCLTRYPPPPSTPTHTPCPSFPHTTHPF